MDYKEMAVPNGVNEDEVGYDAGAIQGQGQAVHHHIQALVNAADADPENVGRRDYTIFVVKDTAGDDHPGRAHTKRLTAPIFQKYTDVAVLSAGKIVAPSSGGPRIYTFAHELGHLLTNNGHYGGAANPENHMLGEYGPAEHHESVSRNLMKNGTRADTDIHGTKRLVRQQEKMILEKLGQ